MPHPEKRRLTGREYRERLRFEANSVLIGHGRMLRSDGTVVRDISLCDTLAKLLVSVAARELFGTVSYHNEKAR